MTRVIMSKITITVLNMIFLRGRQIYLLWNFFYIFLQCIFIEEELLNTKLDVCDGDGDGDGG